MNSDTIVYVELNPSIFQIVYSFFEVIKLVLKWRSDLIRLGFLKIQGVLILILLLHLIRGDFQELQGDLYPWAGKDVFPVGIRQSHGSESEAIWIT